MVIVNDEDVIIWSKVGFSHPIYLIVPGNSVSDITHPRIWYTLAVSYYILLNILMFLIESKLFGLLNFLGNILCTLVQIMISSVGGIPSVTSHVSVAAR